MPFRRVRAVVVTALLVILTAVPRPAHARPASAPARPALRIATSGFVDSFNPFTSIYLLPTSTFRYMYENLVAYDQTDGSPTTGLADRWTTAEDGRTWTFRLQDGLTWSDGKPITAEDVVWTYTQMMTNTQMGQANGSLVANFSKVTAPDEHTVIIILKKPQAPNPGVEIPVVPKHVWSKIKEPWKYPNSSNAVGSGPYILDSYRANQRITFRANPHYWRGAPKISGLQYIYYTNSDAQVQALKSGDVDFVTGLSASQFDALSRVKGVTVHAGTGRRYTAVVLNSGVRTVTGKPFGTGNPALKDVNVRRAIRQAIDIKTLTNKVLDGQATPATSFIPDAFPKWSLPTDDPVLAKFDPAAARKTLDDAGWQVGTDGVRVKDGKKLALRLMVDSTDSSQQSAAEYLRPWLRNVGIAVSIDATDSDSISTRSTSGDYDMYFSGWSINPDPDYQLSINTCATRPTHPDGSGGTSQDGWCSREFDKLYQQQRDETDPTKRQTIVRTMLERNYQDASQVTLWYAKSLEAYRSDRFSGFGLQPKDGGIIAKQVGYWGFLDVAPAGARTATNGTPMTGLAVTGELFVALGVGGIAVHLVHRRNREEVA